MTCRRATGGWCAAPPGVRTIPSVTSSHVGSIGKRLAGTSTSPLCYKRNEMLEEFLRFLLPWTSTLAQTFRKLVCCRCKSSSLSGDFSKYCSCYHIVRSLHELYRQCDFFFKLVRLVYELLYFGIHWSICSLLYRAHKCS